MSDFSNEKVLVTGAKGFIGSKLVERISNEGAECLEIDSIDHPKTNDSFKKINICDYASVKKIVYDFQPSIVFHLAAKVDVSRDISLSDEMMNVNLGGTINIVRACENTNVKRIINTGTCEEYGNNVAPFKEEMLPKPVSPYSTSKVCATMFCQMAHEIKNMPIVTLRPFLTYGPGQAPKMLIPELIISALKDEKIVTTPGEQTREFNYIDDIVHGYLLAAKTKNIEGEVINIGCSQELKIKDVTGMIVEKTGSNSRIDDNLEYRPGEVMHFFSSNQKAKELLNYEPKTSFENGIQKTIDWYRENAI